MLHGTTCVRLGEDLVPEIAANTFINSHKSDDVISRINMQGCNAKLCTSQNLMFSVKKLLENAPEHLVNVDAINNALIPLSIREKH